MRLLIDVPNSLGFFAALSAIAAIASWNQFLQRYLVQGVAETGIKG